MIKKIGLYRFILALKSSEPEIQLYFLAALLSYCMSQTAAGRDTKLAHCSNGVVLAGSFCFYSNFFLKGRGAVVENVVFTTIPLQKMEDPLFQFFVYFLGFKIKLISSCFNKKIMFCTYSSFIVAFVHFGMLYGKTRACVLMYTAYNCTVCTFCKIISCSQRVVDS